MPQQKTDPAESLRFWKLGYDHGYYNIGGDGIPAAYKYAYKLGVDKRRADNESGKTSPKLKVS